MARSSRTFSENELSVRFLVGNRCLRSSFNFSITEFDGFRIGDSSCWCGYLREKLSGCSVRSFEHGRGRQRKMDRGRDSPFEWAIGWHTWFLHRNFTITVSGGGVHGKPFPGNRPGRRARAMKELLREGSAFWAIASRIGMVRLKGKCRLLEKREKFIILNIFPTTFP